MRNVVTVTLHPESIPAREGKPGTALVVNVDMIRSVGTDGLNRTYITWSDGTTILVSDDRTDLMCRLTKRTWG